MKDPVGFFLKEKERLHILKSLQFEIRQGDRIGLLGVNGAGKSSLCRCIAGHYTPTQGNLTVNGRVRAVFDASLGVQPELTGRENARLLAHFLFPEVSDLDALVEEALEFSELGKFIEFPYHIYSNGMQIRLCLSLISARPTDILILDEVFDGADAFWREKISRRVLEMIENCGAVIFVSHSADQITRVCNRLIVLHNGEIIHDGAVADGLERYRRLA